MSSPLVIALASSAISLAALSVAFIALWKTHFSRFSPVCVCGRIRVRIYPIKNEAESWYIASFDVPISITNGGAMPAIIGGLRLALHFPEIPIPNNREHVYPEWEIDPVDVRGINKNRFEWIEKLRISNWMPFAILPKQTITKHLIFETRWNDPVIQKRVECRLEVIWDAQNHWHQIERWELPFLAATWSEMANHGIGFQILPEGSPAMEEVCHPKDLHKYTGSKEPIPKERFTSYHGRLNYPEKP